MALLLEFNGKRPRVAEGVFLAPTAVLIGDVVVEAGTSIWFGAVLRGDFGSIVVGPGCSIQDNAVIHSMEERPTVIGAQVTVGHCAVLEGCQVGDGTIVGMNAVVLPRATVGAEVVVAAGSVVAEGETVPDRVLVAGVPAQVKKELSGRALDWVRRAPREYREISRQYLRLGIGNGTGSVLHEQAHDDEGGH